MKYPDREEFVNGCKAFETYEKRDAMYKVATFLTSYYWGKPSDMANALGVLLLTWNQAFYRYGSLDFDRLQNTIEENLPILEKFRSKDISNFSDFEESIINNLFNGFLDALQQTTNSNKIRKSPVAVAKALHLLAPGFFPIWDRAIAEAYKCNYQTNPAKAYYGFCIIIKSTAEEVKDYITTSNKTIIKRIDEYNYSKYTKGWI